MSKLSQTLKSVVKKPTDKSTFGTNPMDPWSAKAGLSEGALEQYLKSRGINPEFVSRDSKISYAKSAQFLAWKKNHTFEEIIPETMTTEPGSAHKRKAITQKSAHAHKEIKTPPGPGSHNEAKGSQTTALTPEEVQMNESPKEGGRKKFSGMFNSAPKGTFAYDQAMRKKKHDEIEKQQSKDGSGMTSAIDRLEKHLNKEEVAQKEVDKFHKKLDKLVHSTFGKSSAEKKMKEEVEQVDELTKSDYISAVRKTKDPNFSDDEHGPGYKSGRERIIKRAEKHHGKKFGDQLRKDNKWREFGLHKGATKSRTWGNDGKSHTITKDTYKEDVGDPKAAVNADGLPNPQLEPVSEKKKQMSKSARMIKALYKKHKVVKEAAFDPEKEDKSVATYGKKPKMDTTDKKDSIGEKKPQAAATLSGGTTLTGSERDTVEIDPMMRNRPGQPDITKKDDKKDDKKEDKKKDK